MSYWGIEYTIYKVLVFLLFNSRRFIDWEGNWTSKWDCDTDPRSFPLSLMLGLLLFSGCERILIQEKQAMKYLETLLMGET